jgi:hypothetical protein
LAVAAVAAVALHDVGRQAGRQAGRQDFITNIITTLSKPQRQLICW